MSLIIVFNNDKEITWHVGTKPITKMSDINNISYIQADGDELDKILKQYYLRGMDGYTIPVPNDQRLIIWTGDIARSIVANLKYDNNSSKSNY